MTEGRLKSDQKQWSEKVRHRFVRAFTNQMLIHQLQHDIITYNATIHAAGQGFKWVVALELLEETHLSNVRANIITFNSVLSACEKAQKWEKALELYGCLHAFLPSA